VPREVNHNHPPLLPQKASQDLLEKEALQIQIKMKQHKKQLLS